MVVWPSAKAAATARMGYSSIIDGARPGGTSTPRKRRVPRGDVADPLAALLALVRDGEVGAHLAQRLEQPGAQRIEQHALDRRPPSPG